LNMDRLIFVLTVSLFGCRAAVADPPRDWPCLGGSPSRNAVNFTETNLSEQPHAKWMAKLGSRSHGGPVIATGRVFVGTNNSPGPDQSRLLCFRETDGQLLWKRATDKLPDPTANDWPRIGICSTPFVEGDRLWYVTNRCEVACLNVQDGGVVWSFDMIGKLKVQPHRMSASSPVVAGDAVFVVTGNGWDGDHTEIPAPDAPSFLALDKTTGRVLWHDKSPGRDIIHGQWGSPAYGELAGRTQVIFPGGDGKLYSFEPKTGKPLWKFDCNPKGIDAENKNFPIAAPVIVGGRVYLGTGQNPEYADGPGDLWCLEPKAGGQVTVVWHVGGVGKFGRTVSSCAIHDGLLYAGDLAGFVYCFDAKTGAKQWDYDTKAHVWASPLWADGKVYLGTEAGELFFFRHGRAAKLLAKTDLGAPILASTAAANGVLFVMTATHLHALIRK
ncbi:MAG: PQQ-binding-like beta-propeller repeat protein, partial [Gemmataceae bacterium]